MALRRAYALNDTPTGNACNNAYIRIANVRFPEGRDEAAVITLDYWTTKAAYNSGQFVPWKTDRTSYVMDPFDHEAAGNLKTRIYTWLKTRPEFLTAVDE